MASAMPAGILIVAKRPALWVCEEKHTAGLFFGKKTERQKSLNYPLAVTDKIHRLTYTVYTGHALAGSSFGNRSWRNSRSPFGPTQFAVISLFIILLHTPTEIFHEMKFVSLKLAAYVVADQAKLGTCGFLRSPSMKKPHVSRLGLRIILKAYIHAIASN